MVGILNLLKWLLHALSNCICLSRVSRLSERRGRLATRQVTFSVKLGGLATENKQSHGAEAGKENNQQQPVPPNLIGIGFHRIQQIVAAVVRLGVSRIAVFKFCHQENSNRIRQGAKVAGPSQPFGDQIGRHKKACRKEEMSEQQSPTVSFAPSELCR